MIMAALQKRWDIGDEIVVRTQHPRPLVGTVASSAIQIVFAALTVTGPSLQPAQVSTSKAVLDVVRIPRKDVRIERGATRRSDRSDTNIGMSTGRLANLFPRLFRPTEEEDECNPLFMT
jgi:hypothetical protein